MVEQQQTLVLSPYMEIYELVVPKDNLLRQIKELGKGIGVLQTTDFHYKTYIVMTEEQIITAATIISGEKTDGKELPSLV